MGKEWSAAKTVFRSAGMVSLIMVLTSAVLIWLFFLHRSDQLHPNAAKLSQLHQLEDKTAALEKRLTALSAPVAQNTKQPDTVALTQELDLLSAQIKLTEDQINEAEEAEKRTREAATAFLGVFAILAAIVLGQGYLNLFEFTKRGDEIAQRLKDTDALYATYQQEVKEFTGHREVLDQIQKTWETVSGEGLEGFLVDARKVLDKEENLELSEQLAVMEEIDAYTYLYPLSRFGKKTPEIAQRYTESQIQSMRGLIAKKNYHQTLRRIADLVKSKGLSNEQLGRARSYEAYVYYLLITRMMDEPSWVRQTKREEIERSCWKAKEALDASATNAPNWLFAIFVRAQFYSILPKIATEFAIPSASLPHGGRREAAAEYMRVLEDRTFRNRHAVLQNLACELKFIAAESGDDSDWQQFTSALQRYPDAPEMEREYEECKRREQSRPQLLYVWQSMMMDSDLFQTLGKIDHQKAREFWIALLEIKVKPAGKWRKDLKEIQTRVPAAKQWQLNLLA